ncbi:MAG TPA: hypothetical protein VEO20_01580 [Thermoplasmata archaeon]|nr:hypothetical protein [Thermoplasmata archaeon]
MFGRVLLTGVLVIAVAWGNAVILSDAVIGPTQAAAIDGGCLGPPGPPPPDAATCTRLLSLLALAGKINIEVIFLTIVGILLLLIGFFLSKPPPDLLRLPEEDVSSEWRATRIPAKVRIVVFGTILTLLAVVAGSAVVLSVVLALFAFLLMVWRHRLTPRLLERSLLLPLGLEVSLLAYAQWGLVGLIAVEDPVITITGLVIALSFLRY